MSPPVPPQLPVRLLVVDDRPENLVAIRGALRRPGLQIDTASSGAEALRQVLRHDFAVILMDVLMPEMDGFEAAEMIHGREASRHVPIIFLTAAGYDRALVSRGYAMGAADYLVKPLDVAVMRAKIAVFIDLYRRKEASRREHQRQLWDERALSRAALSHSEALFEATFRDARLGVGHLGRDGRWLRVNPMLCDILDARADLLIGQPLSAHLAPMAPTAGGAASPLVSGDYTLCRAGAPARLVEVRISAFAGGSGAGPEAWMCMAEDVSLRRRANRRQAVVLEITQELLRSRDAANIRAIVARRAVPVMGDWCLIEQLAPGGDGAVEHALVHHDSAAGEAAGEAYRALQAREPGLLGPRLGGDGPRLFAGVEAAFPHVLAADPATLALLDILGHQSLIVVSMTAGAEPLGSLMFGYGTGGAAFDDDDLVAAEDLGQRVALALDNARLYAQSQRAVAIRDEFMSIASHELRTPLTPLLMQLQRMGGGRGEQATALPLARVQGIAARSVQQVQRLAALVDSLLDVSRIASGKFTLNPEFMDLADTVREVVERYSEKLAAAECELRVDLESKVLGCWDPLRLEQVVVNLLSNAVKYGGGKPIELAVRRERGQAQLVVQDHGIGIDPARLAHIFERFERATADRQFSGLGLGLYIVREILAAHGGHVDVDSEHPGGSRFTVWLPLAEQNVARGAAGPAG